MSDLRAALETALAENPDDLATHMAYADHLAEQGDPRGEFIQVQLALEDETRTAEERNALRCRERELLAAHEAEWLGELAPLLLGTTEQRETLFLDELEPRAAEHATFLDDEVECTHGWARGWLDRFECGWLGVEMARKLGRSPIARLLRGLIVRLDNPSSMYLFEPGPDLPTRPWFYNYEALASYPAIRNVRVFQYGREVDPEEDAYVAGTQFDCLAPFIVSMPRLEELSIFGHIYLPANHHADSTRLFSLPLANLRVLRYYHGLIYPLSALAANPALGRLTHLLIYPHSFGRTFHSAEHVEPNGALHADTVRPVFTSPHLQSLTHLQLRCADGGDGMIQDVVASGILKRLKMLDLRHGLVTDAGARLLADCLDARNLEVLDLINNRLTHAGITALQIAGIKVRAERQQEPPFHDGSILGYGDSE